MKIKNPLLIRAAVLTCLFVSPVIGFGSQRNKPVTQIPFELTNNLILLQTHVNDSRPLPFILDTGASSSVVNQKLVSELGLKVEAEGESTTGGGEVETSYIKEVKLSIPGAELRGVTLAAIDLSGIEAGFGQPVGGILGYDIFQRYVVEIDYANRIVRLYEPDGYRYSGKGQALPITVEEQTPFIRARVLKPGGGLAEGMFEFDTGQVGAITLTNSFVAGNNLLESSRKSLEITTGAILAGRVNARVSRIEGLQLGNINVKEPVATIAQGEQDAGVEADKAGLIGGEFLRRFTVIVDYKRSRVILAANGQQAVPFEFDMSGMSLSAQGARLRSYKVRTLVAASPAAEAGIRVGDVLTALDGRPAAEMTLDQIRGMFRRENREYALSIERGSEKMQIKLRTRKLI